MELLEIVFEATRRLWLVFVFAAPLAIWLVLRGRTRMASYLVGGEIALTLLLVLVGVIAGWASDSQGAGWDVMGIILWAVVALLVAGVTGVIIAGIILAEKIAERGV